MMKKTMKAEVTSAIRADLERCLVRFRYQLSSFDYSEANLSLQTFRWLKLKLPDNHPLVQQIESTYTQLEQELDAARCQRT